MDVGEFCVVCGSSWAGVDLCVFRLRGHLGFRFPWGWGLGLSSGDKGPVTGPSHERGFDLSGLWGS